MRRRVLILPSHCRITPQLHNQKSGIIHQISNQRLAGHPGGILVFEPATDKAQNGVCMRNNCSDWVSSSLEKKLLRREVIKIKWAEKGKQRIVVHLFSRYKNWEAAAETCRWKLRPAGKGKIIFHPKPVL